MLNETQLLILGKSPLCSFNASINMYFLADITKKVPIYIHFVEKLQTFDLRALGAVFVENLDGGQFILFYDRVFK